MLQEQLTKGLALESEISDYEVRRELLRAQKLKGLERLDVLAGRLHYLPLSTAAMRQAAVFWAQARRQGQPTAADQALDGDVILAGQAMTFGAPDVLVATTNVGHLSRFVPAELWQKHRPPKGEAAWISTWNHLPARHHLPARAAP